MLSFFFFCGKLRLILSGVAVVVVFVVVALLEIFNELLPRLGDDDDDDNFQKSLDDDGVRE